jgi:hypothetical protein
MQENKVWQTILRPSTQQIWGIGATVGTIVGTIVLPQQSFAATLARSDADVKVFDFSHKVESVLVDGTTAATADSTIPDQVTADADGDVEFDDLTQIATNSTRTLAQGKLPSYQGNAKAKLMFNELNFAIGAGDLFQFNFTAMLDVFAKTPNPFRENAVASGNIAFRVFQVGADNSLKLLDSLNVGGINVGIPKTFFGQTATQNFQVTSQRQGSQLSLSGLFSRRFESATNLRIMQVNQNQSTVRAGRFKPFSNSMEMMPVEDVMAASIAADSIDVPEPMALFGLLGIASWGFSRSQRRCQDQ